MATFKKMKGFFFLSALTVVVYFGTLFIFPPCLLLLLLPYGISIAERPLTFAASTFYKLTPALLEVVFGVRVKISGDLNKLEGPCLLIINHRTRFDWLFLWCYLMRMGDIQLLKIVLKEAIKNIPVIGWGMQEIQYIFITRKWEVDEKLMKESLAYFTEVEYPLQLLLFPEGTDLSLFNKKKDQNYAKKNGLQMYEYVLHPRTKGFCLCVQELRKGRIPPTVVDISVGYLGCIPQDEKYIASGNWPSEIHFHSELVASSELPPDDQGLAQWLEKRWEEKEKQLEDFYSNKKFSSKYLSDKKIRESYGEMKKVMIIWSVFLAYIGYNLCTNMFYWMYYPIITSFYLILNYFTDGIDHMILRRHRLFK